MFILHYGNIVILDNEYLFFSYADDMLFITPELKNILS